VSFNIVKPLLRGAGRDVAAENLTQANRNVIYAIRDYTNFQHEFSRDIVLQYFRLLQQKESVHNELQNYKSRQANTAYLKARSVDRASSQEVGDSEQGELQAKNRWINAQARYQTSLDDFKLRLGMPTTAKLTLEDKELNRLVSVGLHPVHLSSKEAFHIALNNRLPLMNEIDQFDDTKRQIKIAANQLKAGLDFTGRVSLPSGDNRLDHLDFNDLSSQVGLELSLPINQQHERNSYRRALIHFEANIRSLSRAYDRLNNQIKQRIRQIDQYKKNYEIQKGAVELALKRVEENRLRMLAGTLIFRRLSESQDALIHAQNAVTNALIDYQQARLELFTDIGILDSSSSGYWLKAKPTKKYNE
jgi:outer membrane protein TolC